MTTKSELEAAFEAGVRYAQDDYAPAPASVPDFAEWYADFAHERRVACALAKAQKKARTNNAGLALPDWPDDPELWGDK